MLTIKRITSNDHNVDESQLLAGIDFVPRGNSLEPPLLIQVVNILRFFQFLQGTISNISFFFSLFLLHILQYNHTSYYVRTIKMSFSHELQDFCLHK